jgi:hypothetical protein
MGSFELYDLLGRLILVGSPEPGAAAAIRQLLSGFGPVKGPAAPDVPRYQLDLRDGTWFVHVDRTPLHADRDFVVALGMLEWHLVTEALGRHNHLFHLHGAALAAPDLSGAVVLSGKSGSGKSTLTLALMQRGFLPFADDVALIEPGTLNVHAFHRAFHVDTDSLGRVEAFTGGPVPTGGDAPPGFLHPHRWAPAPVPVRWVLLLELEPESPPSLTRLSAGEAAVAVLEHSLNLQQASRAGLATAARLTDRAECYRFRHGPWPESLALVQELSGASRAPQPGPLGR